MPIQARPSGQRVGGVSEETDERRSRIRPPSSFDAVVEGIPAFGTASPFAGRRSNVGLGRSVMLDAGILPPSGSAPVTADVRRGTEEGNVVRLRHKAQATAFDGYPSSVGDASFTRSFDPFTSPPRQHRGRKSGWWGIDEGIAVGQTCASGKNRHRGLRRWTMRGSPRVTALARELRDASEKEGGHGLRPCEDRRARVW
jgi:hypothetical protein